MKESNRQFWTTSAIPSCTTIRYANLNTAIDHWVFHERMKDFNLGEALRIPNSPKVWQIGHTKRSQFPEESSGTNLMLYIQNPQDLCTPITLKDLTRDEMEVGASIIGDFLNIKPNGFVAWSVSYEPKGSERKQAGQSIATFHAHLMADFQDALIRYDTSKGPIPQKYHGERLPHRIEQLYVDFFSKNELFEKVLIGSEKEVALMQLGPYSNQGGVLLRISGKTKLQEAILDIDQTMRTAYDLIAEVNAENNDAVRASDYKDNFKSRGISEAAALIEKLEISENNKRFLRKIAPLVRHSDDNDGTSETRPFRAATYTCSCFLNDGNYTILVTPHFFQNKVTSRTDLGLIRGEVIRIDRAPRDAMPKNFMRAERLYDEVLSLRQIRLATDEKNQR